MDSFRFQNMKVGLEIKHIFVTIILNISRSSEHTKVKFFLCLIY
jgi:hypothetical protein